MDQYINLIVHYGAKVIGVFVLFAVAWIISGIAKNLLIRTLTKVKFDETLTKFFGNALKYLVLVVSIISILGIFGVETTSFAAVIGAAGLAIGLAFQGTLSNLAAGVMMLAFRPFKVGDVVNLSGTVGKVIEIDLFMTLLDTPDNRRIIVPNGAVFGSTIENISFHPTRRVDINVGTEYGASLEEARKVLSDTASAIEARLKDQDVVVMLLGLGNSSIDWQVRIWVKTEDYWAIKDSATQALKNALDQAGIGIPFPQMDVHLDPLPGTASAAGQAA